MKFTSNNIKGSEASTSFQEDLEIENKATPITYKNSMNEVPEVSSQSQTEFKYELEQIYIKEELGIENGDLYDSPEYVNIKAETFNADVSHALGEREIKLEVEQHIDCHSLPQVVKVKENIDGLNTNIPTDLEDKEDRGANTEATQILDITINDKEASNLNKDLFSCNQCTFTTLYKFNLKQHQKTHDNDRERFSCEYCNDTFFEKLSLEGHLLCKHKDQIKISGEVTTNLEIWNCEHCKYSTFRKGDLAKHLLIHSNSKPHVCTICSKSFIKKGNLNSHIISHHSDNKDLMSTLTNKIYECQQCSYKCVYMTKLKLHMVKHRKPTTDLQKFSCEQCVFSTYHKTSLIKHSVIHRKNKPHVCSSCSKSFNQKWLLDSHIVNIHTSNTSLMATVTNKIYKCTEQKCTFQNVSSSKMKAHMLEHKNLFFKDK